MKHTDCTRLSNKVVAKRKKPIAYDCSLDISARNKVVLRWEPPGVGRIKVNVDEAF
jgi:hypothetical protein